MTRNGWKFKGRTVCGIALVCFAAGSLMSARVARIQQARANSNRIFELRVYHVVPGKMPALVEKVDSMYMHPTDFSPMK